MSTRAIILFCDGQREAGAIVLTSDGYPSFARYKVLAKLVEEYPTPCNMDMVFQLFQTALADGLDLDIYANDEKVVHSALEQLMSCFYLVNKSALL